MTWTAPRTWLTGELVTASLMNTHIRDNLLHLYLFDLSGGRTVDVSTLSSSVSTTSTSWQQVNASWELNVSVTTGRLLLFCGATIHANNTGAGGYHRLWDDTNSTTLEDYAVAERNYNKYVYRWYLFDSLTPGTTYTYYMQHKSGGTTTVTTDRKSQLLALEV